MRARNPSTLCALALAFAIAAAPRARAVIIDFNSGTFDWSNPLAWLVSGVPGAKDTARISGGTLSLDNAFTVEGLTLSGGNLTGTGSLTLNGPGSTWSGGTLSGTGTLFLASTAGLTISPASSATLNARQIVNAGNITWSDGQVNTGQGATIVNQSGAFFTLTSDGTFAFNLSGTRTAITNAGTFAKTGGTNTSDIQASLSNTGALNVSSGTLQLSGGGTSSGNVTIGTGAKLKIANNAFEFASGTVLNGPGALEIASGTTTLAGTITGSANLIVSGGTATVTGTTTTTGGGTLSSGTINGTGTLTFGNVVSISGGTIADAGTLNLNGGAAITGFVSINGNRTLNLSGNSTWTGGTISTTNATINVGSGATLDTTVNSAISLSGSTPSVFNNQGNVIKSAGTGTTSIDAVFNNTGSLKVLAGNVTLSRGGNSTGTIQIASGSSLFLSSGNFGIADGATLTGPGTLQVSGGNTTFAGNQTSSARLGVSGGNLTVNGVTTTSSGLTLSGGTLTTSGTLNIGDPASISGGTLTGAGNVNLSSGVAVSGSVSILGGVKLNLDDNSTWTGGSLTGGGGSIVTIKPGASLSTTFNGGFYSTTGGGAIVNQGTFTKAGGAGPGETYIDAVFNNTGTLDIQTGTLNLAEGGNLSGTVNISSGASLSLSSQTFVLADSLALTGTGKLLVSGGNATLGGNRSSTVELAVSSGNLSVTGNTSTAGLLLTGGTLTVPGTLNISDPASLTGGTLTGSGNVNLNSGAAIAGGLSVLGGIKLNLDDASTWTSGSLSIGGGSVTTIKNGASLTTGFDGNLYNATGGATIVNQGTFTKSGGTGQTYIDAVFNNTGTVNVQTGTVNLAEGGSSSGTVNVSSGAILLLNQNTFTFQDGAQLTGDGTIRTSGGTTEFIGNQTATTSLVLTSGNLSVAGSTTTSGTGSISGGTYKGPGNLTFGGTLTISGGTLEGTGNLSANGGADLTGSFTLNSGRNLILGANSTWSSGTISGGTGSTLTIKPGVNLATSHNGTLSQGSGTRTTVVNQGTITKTTATGTSQFNAIVQNSGKISVERGVFELAGGGFSTGIVELASDAILAITSETFAFQTGSTITGSGRVRVTGGTATFTGGQTTTASFELDNSGKMTFEGVTETSGKGYFQGGTLNGAGTLSFADLVTLGGSVTLGGTGTLNANGGASLDGTLYLAGSQTLALGGNSTWSAGSINGNSTNTLTIKAGATLTNTHNANIYTAGGGRATVQNLGTFAKTTATGTTALDAIFNNTGVIDVQTGVLELDAGGSSSGTINIASGATLAIGGGTFAFSAGSTVNGPGTLRVQGGSSIASFGGIASTAQLAVTHGFATFAGANSFSGASSMSGGTIGGSGTLTLSSLFTITGGTFDGAGTLQANGGLALGNSLNLKGGYSLVLGGASTWTDGTIYGGGASSILIKSGASLTASGNGSLSSYYTGGATTFRNEGTFTKATSTATIGIDAPYTNVGTTRVDAGRLDIKQGGSSTGNIEVASGATFAVENGSFSFDAGSRLLGAGTILISGGTGIFGGTSSATANISMDSGTTTLTGNTVTSGGGTLSAGTVTGSGSLTYGAPLTLSGSVVFSGTGVVLSNGGATISSSFSLKDGQTLTLAGATTFSGGYIYHGGGSILNNSGTLTATSGLNLYHYYGGSKLVFNNSGTFNKTSSGADGDFDAVFNNTGAVNVQAGTLTLYAGGLSSGTVAISSGAKLEVHAGSFFIADGSQVTGAGILALTGGTLTLSGTLGVDTFTQTAGNLAGSHTLTKTINVSYGSWDGAAGATTTLANGATLNLSGSDFTFDKRKIFAASGSKIYWTQGYLRSGNGGSFVNEGEFYDRTASGYSIKSNGLGGTFTFDNRGLYQREGAYTTYIEVPFLNSGTVNLNQGSLELRGGGTMSATSVVNAAAGTTFRFAGDYTLLDGAQFLGGGTYRQDTGTLTIDGNLRASNFTWAGGDWNSATTGATTTLASGTTLTFNGYYSLNFDKRNITVASGAKAVWESGYLEGSNGSILTNNGTFHDRNANGYSAQVDSSFGGTFNFVNNGTYLRDVAGTTYFNVPFNNSGTVELNSGTLYLNAGGTASAAGIFNIASPATLHIQNGYTALDGAQFRGAGKVVQNGGTVDIVGALKADHFLWQSGDWNSATAGATTSIADGTLLRLSSYNLDFNRRSITVDSGATVSWEYGHLRGGNGSTFVNNGTFYDRAQGYSVVGGDQRDGLGGAFSFVNNGTYIRAGAGTTYFTAPFNNTGSISISNLNSSLQLSGGGTMSGSSVVDIVFNATLNITNDYTLVSGARFTGMGFVVHSAGTLTVNGNLNATNFRWTGGDWNSPTAGATTTIGGGPLTTTLTIAGGGRFDNRTLNLASNGVIVWQHGYLTSTDSGGIINNGLFIDTQSSGYAIKPTPIIAGTTETPLEADSDGQAVTAPVTGMSFTNNGTYIKQGGGSTYIEVPFTNAGTLTLNGGNIYFNSTFTNTGSITFSSGAQLHASSPLTFSASSPLSGTGTINGSVTAAGQVAPGNSPGKLQITGTLSLLSTSTLLIELGGATQGVDYDYLQVGGTATIAGNLSLTLINGYASIVDSTKTFTVLTSAGLTGAFANIGSGQRLVTTDGLGSFLVTYGSATNSVVLSQFQAIPEPSTYMMLALGAGLILFLQRRRARR